MSANFGIFYHYSNYKNLDQTVTTKFENDKKYYDVDVDTSVSPNRDMMEQKTEIQNSIEV